MNSNWTIFILWSLMCAMVPVFVYTIYLLTFTATTLGGWLPLIGICLFPVITFVIGLMAGDA